MDVQTLLSVSSMVLLIAIGAYGVWASLREYRRHRGPIRLLARTLAESFIVFSFIGALGVALTITYSPEAWVIQAASSMVGYLMLAGVTLRILKGMKNGKDREEHEEGPGEVLEFPSAVACVDRERAIEGLRILREYIGVPLLVVSRTRPDEWRKKTEIEPTEYVWLTRVEHPSAVSPTNLHVLGEKIGRFLREHRGGFVYIEGIEYLLFYNDFRALTKFLTSVRDTAILMNGHVILLVDPETLEPGQLSIILKEFERIDLKETLEKVLGPTLFGYLPPKKVKKNASAEGSEEGSGAGEEKAEEARPLRREETAKEGR